MESSRERDFKVGSWWIRPRLKEMHRGEEVARLEAKSVDVLRCLALQAPQVVSKEQILDSVWSGVYVGDQVISHAIWELRRVFEDDAKRPRYIQTVPKKGYRLVAQVTWAQGDGRPEEGARIGPYEILETLGSGAMGIVHMARDVRLDRIVALKFLAPELTLDDVARKRFRREAKLAAAMDHPHLGTLYEIGETHEGRLYLATAYYDGGTLKDRLQEQPLPWPEAVRIGCSVAQGLAEMHRLDMVHRDVKPANILLTRTGGVKLVDFGIARWVDATRLTRTGASLGTPSYKSPEQSRGDDVDHRTDIWSLGVVLFEALSGQRPFTAEYEQAVIHAILERDPPTLQEVGTRVPEGLEEILHRTLAKEPDDRFQDAGALAQALGQLDAEGSISLVGAADELDHRMDSSNRPKKSGRLLRVLVSLGLLLTALFLQLRSNSNSKSTDRLQVTSTTYELADKSVAAGSSYEREDSLTQLQRATQAYRSALSLAPDHPEVHARLALNLIRIHIQSPDETLLREAKEHLELAGVKNPEHWLTWFAKAKFFFFDQDYENAVEAARVATQEVPSDGIDQDLTWALYGESLIELGQLQEGLAALERAIASEPFGSSRSRLILARRLSLLGQLEEAVEQYEMVRRVDPSDIKVLTNLGLLYVQLARPAEALPLLEDAQRFEPRDPSRLNNLAFAYFAWGVTEDPKQLLKAEEIFRQAIHLDPGYPMAHYGLGDTLEMLGRETEAQEAFGAALSAYNALPKVTPFVEAVRAVCLARLGRTQQALAAIETLRQRDTDPREWAFEATQVDALAGRDEVVYSRLQEAVSNGENLYLYQIDPVFRRYREDPRFRALLESPKP